jgi:hypothetical protein
MAPQALSGEKKPMACGPPAPTRRSVGEATWQVVIGAGKTQLPTPAQTLSAREDVAIPRVILAAHQLRELPPDLLHLGVKTAQLQK